MKEKILITGGCGYIGSHTCLTFLENDYEVVVLDSLENSSYQAIMQLIIIGKLNNKDFSNKLKFYKGDLRDKPLVKEVFMDAKSSGNPINSVIHFAGLKSVSESVEKPLLYWDKNLISTIYLLDVMQEFNCYKIIFSSSASVYGKQSGSLINESFITNPANTYANTKLTIEILLRDLFNSRKSDFKIVILRYFNPVGAHRSGLIGENPSGIPNNLFPMICNVGLGLKDFLNIYGNDWETHDGTCIRDYIHIEDLAEAHYLSSKLMKKDFSKLLIINVGTAKGKSVLDVVNTFSKVNNCNIPYKFLNRRDGDVANLVADNSMAKRILGWAPRFSFVDMCKDAWKWSKLTSKDK